jgi:hypothetical protein
MSISLKDLRKVRATLPPRILIYGEPGVGKTSLSASFPSPVFLQIEDGTPADVELVSFGKLDTFAQVMDALASLYQEPHDFKTLVLDSISELQRLVFAETCNRGDDKGNKKNNIEDFGYGKGYVYAQRIWQEILDGVNALRRDLGMTVILIAHSTIERFDDPENTSYNRWAIDLNGKSLGMIERDMDAIFLVKRGVTVKKEDQGFKKERAVADGGSTVFIHTEGRAAFDAKNRYNLPPKIKFDKGQGYEALAPYLPGGAPETSDQKAA